jgi:hypothetical protein
MNYSEKQLLDFVRIVVSTDYGISEEAMVCLLKSSEYSSEFSNEFVDKVDEILRSCDATDGFYYLKGK